MLEKIPVEFLLKCSRQECGELKSEIDELKYIIDKKNEEILKLNKKVKKYKDLTRVLTPAEQVNRSLSQVLGGLKYIKDSSKPKRVKKQLKLYKRVSKYYNAWYDACKLLYSILQEIKEIHIE